MPKLMFVSISRHFLRSPNEVERGSRFALHDRYCCYFVHLNAIRVNWQT